MMTENKFIFKINTVNSGLLEIPIKVGEVLFILGANGVGKSTLMHSIFSANKEKAKRLLAHRQTWFTSNSIDISANQKQQAEKQIKQADSQNTTRWQDSHSAQRASLSIYDLINSENIRARQIAAAVDAKDIDTANAISSEQSPIQAINELLNISNIPIKIIHGEKHEQLFASKNGSAPYSIAELSDGERNALLIAADVLTAEPDSLIIIDEPERHLHRSIISPLLSSLFAKRNDCAFAVSTHDLQLPIDNFGSSTLLIRSCNWSGKTIESWDADFIPITEKIPDGVKLEILGSKRKILFVEGEKNSLDKQIYQLIFPDVTVQPVGSCSQVEKAVEGIKSSEDLHWLEVYGLIDADDRTEENIEALRKRKIIALKSYSVESLYYNLDIIKFVANRYAEITGQDEDELFEKAIARILDNFKNCKDRLCARLCEKRVRAEVMTMLPNHKDIASQKTLNLNLSLSEYYKKEEAIFDQLIAEKNLNELIQRYPSRETPVLNDIASGLGIDRHTYENIVRKLVIDNKEVHAKFLELLKELSDQINTI